MLGDWSFKGTLIQTKKQIIFSCLNNEQYTENFFILKFFELFTRETCLFLRKSRPLFNNISFAFVFSSNHLMGIYLKNYGIMCGNICCESLLAAFSPDWSAWTTWAYPLLLKHRFKSFKQCLHVCTMLLHIKFDNRSFCPRVLFLWFNECTEFLSHGYFITLKNICRHGNRIIGNYVFVLFSFLFMLKYFLPHTQQKIIVANEENLIELKYNLKYLLHALPSWTIFIRDLIMWFH